MTDENMHEELEQLRAEVAELADSRASKKKAEAQSETTPVEPQAKETNDDIDIVEQARATTADDPELTSQFDQLIEHLEHEIKDLPAITTLAVFSLGVLFGRLLR